MSADVQGECPACGGRSLFLAAGGYVTCRRADCPNPTMVADLMDRFSYVAGAVRYVWHIAADLVKRMQPLIADATQSPDVERDQ